MNLKKTIKFDIKEKGLRLCNGQVVNEDGIVLNLVDMLEKAFGAGPFEFSATTKTEENYDLAATD